MKNSMFIWDETGGMILDYRIAAKQMLCNYKYIRCAVDNLNIRIEELRDMLTAINSPDIRERVQGGKLEDKKLSILCEIDRLEGIREFRLSDIHRMDSAFELLSEEQKSILWEFYVEGENGHVERLMEKLSLERRTVYYRHDQALKKFTLAMFGACDL